MQLRRKVTVVAELSPTQSESPGIEDVNREAENIIKEEAQAASTQVISTNHLREVRVIHYELLCSMMHSLFGNEKCLEPVFF